MSDSEGELACMHVDVVAALCHVELAIGLYEQQDKALQKQATLIDKVTKREVQSNIFGVRTMKVGHGLFRSFGSVGDYMWCCVHGVCVCALGDPP